MKLLAVVHILLYILLNSDACLEIRITAEDSTVVVARSLELAFDLKSDVIVEPKGQPHTAHIPDECIKSKKQPMKWTNIESLVYIDALKLHVAADGQNTAGLSVGALLFPGFSKYQDIQKNKCGSVISQMEFPLWILGNFRTVQELRDAINEDSFPLVYKELVPVDGDKFLFELHYSVTDKTGDGIIIEFNDQGRKVHENTFGVLTNSPSYDFQMLNLRNYVHLSNYARDPLVLGKEELKAFGEGSGLLGMPGDLTPPSRLVRAAMLVNFASAAKTSDEAVNLATHLMNNFDIAHGLLKVRDVEESDYTQWIVIKDLHNNVLYFRGYEDITLYAIRLDNTVSGSLPIPIRRPMGGAVDITNELKLAAEHTEL